MIQYIFMAMRVTNFYPFVFFLVFYLSPFAGLSQQKEANHLIKIHSGEIRLDSLAAQMFRFHNYIFSFNSKKLKPGKEIAIPAKKLTIAELFSLVSEQLGVQYTLRENYIIFYNGASKTKKPKTIKKEDTPASKKITRKNTDSLEKNNDTATISSLNNMTDTAILKDSDQNKVVKSPAAPSSDTNHIIKNDIINKPNAVSQTKADNKLLKKINDKEAPKKIVQNKVAGERSTFSPYLSAFVRADETMYLNAGINAGFPWLFGILNGSTNFKVSPLLYGIGTSFPLGNKWRIQLSGITGGHATKSYILNGYQISKDSTKKNLSVKGAFSRIDLAIQRSIGQKTMIEFGPVINFLSSRYYQNGSLVAIKELLPSDPTPDKTYYVLKPPYTLSNNYNTDGTVNKKIWVGFKIGLVYIFK